MFQELKSLLSTLLIPDLSTLVFDYCPIFVKSRGRGESSLQIRQNDEKAMLNITLLDKMQKETIWRVEVPFGVTIPDIGTPGVFDLKENNIFLDQKQLVSYVQCSVQCSVISELYRYFIDIFLFVDGSSKRFFFCHEWPLTKREKHLTLDLGLEELDYLSIEGRTAPTSYAVIGFTPVSVLALVSPDSLESLCSKFGKKRHWRAEEKSQRVNYLFEEALPADQDNEIWHHRNGIVLLCRNVFVEI